MNPPDPDQTSWKPTKTGGHGWRGLVAAFGVSTVTVVLLLATSTQFGMAWDEGYTIRRERLLGRWFEQLASPAEPGQRRGSFEKSTLDRFWLFSREEPHGHPPFYALLGLAGHRLGHLWLPPLESHRLGPILLTAATSGLIFLHLARRKGMLAGLTASSLFVAMPRTFAHAHYAHYDMPMTCLWLLAQVAFCSSLESRRWAVAFGIALGLSAGTKFTGLFAVVPALLWVALREFKPGSQGRPGLRSLAIGLPVAVLTLYAIQPPWWVEPLAGPARFVVSNLTRARTQPLATLYLGQVYDFALPWHNTFVLTVVTTPLLVLGLALVGILASLAGRRNQPALLIWPLSWATLMIVRALPNAPGHDGIRLILPSIVSLAMLAALGVGWLDERFAVGWRRLIPRLVAAATIGESVVGITQTYPYTDSYYNVAVGGLGGAERLGFELTYYWETASTELFRWAGDASRDRPITLAFPMDSAVHDLLREWGKIPPKIRIIDLNSPASGKPLTPDFLVLQRRKGLYYPSDRWLDRQGHPVFTIRRQGVDLLRVYRAEEDREAFERTRNEPVPNHLRR